MATAFEKSGTCLCRAVRFSVQLEHRRVTACHCSMCRHWGSGPAMTVDTAHPIRFEDETHLSVYDSSEWAERGFCALCGTHLFYRLKAGGFHSISVDVLQGAEDWAFAEQFFIDERPAYYCFANRTEELTGREVFARFGGE
ncbi:GFA family protein [Pseudomonas matsuisoli]|uniref:Aldehyde-activating protein n=1 Tax=Pseudomonas matsuisoli TaxID=1515666 RepID=A0A917PVB2_9PSED|nr:GFA family protein [Pseudomonas matsuisoli]GGJ93590.1 aldehyde-activating protein [Pseudomonas matsuisoli]